MHLYFDIDGTVVTGFGQAAKPRLAEGAFQDALEAAQVERLTCVGNAVAIFQALERAGHPQDVVERVYLLCQGAFRDLEWLRGRLEVASFDPHERGAWIEAVGDWLYVDDLAERYLAEAGRAELFAAQAGRRILGCDPEGCGGDVLAWLAGFAKG